VHLSIVIHACTRGAITLRERCNCSAARPSDAARALPRRTTVRRSGNTCAGGHTTWCSSSVSTQADHYCITRDYRRPFVHNYHTYTLVYTACVCVCVCDLPQRDPRCNVFLFLSCFFLSPDDDSNNSNNIFSTATTTTFRQRKSILFRSVRDPLFFSFIFFFSGVKNRARTLVNPSRPRVGARDVVEEVAAR